MAAVPAWAATPAHPAHPSHPSAHSCKVRSVGYNARGTLVSGELTPAGKRDRYNGELTVKVTRANHSTPKGPQTFTLTDARARFGKGVSSTAPAAGDLVALHGKITVLQRHCSCSDFTPKTTVRDVQITLPPKH